MTIENYTKNAEHVISYVTKQFGDEAEIQVDEVDIIRWINMGQRDIITNNTSINKALARTAIVANQAMYPLDADTAFKGVQNIFAVLVDGIPLIPMSLQEALIYLRDNSGNSAGNPSIWYVSAGILNLWPKPKTDIPDGLAIHFNRAAAEITAKGETLGIPDNFYNALVQYVMQQAYEMDENFQAAQIKGQQFEKSVNIQQNQSTTQTAFYPVITPDPEDYY